MFSGIDVYESTVIVVNWSLNMICIGIDGHHDEFGILVQWGYAIINI